jgi:hypothetical protein
MNYLKNGGFEIGSQDTGSDAADWLVWWEETPKPKDGFDYAYKPSWNRELISNGAAQGLVYAEDASLRIYNNWNPFHAGVYQKVVVPVGKNFSLSAQSRVWAAQDSWPTPSDESVNARVQVGIDLNGGSNFLSSDVHWSNVVTPHNRWLPIMFQFRSTGENVTVFLSVNYRGESRQFMTCFFDEIALTDIYNAFLPIVNR